MRVIKAIDANISKDDWLKIWNDSVSGHLSDKVRETTWERLMDDDVPLFGLMAIPPADEDPGPFASVAAGEKAIASIRSRSAGVSGAPCAAIFVIVSSPWYPSGRNFASNSSGDVSGEAGTVGPMISKPVLPEPLVIFLRRLRSFSGCASLSTIAGSPWITCTVFCLLVRSCLRVMLAPSRDQRLATLSNKSSPAGTRKFSPKPKRAGNTPSFTCSIACSIRSIRASVLQ